MSVTSALLPAADDNEKMFFVVSMTSVLKTFVVLTYYTALITPRRAFCQPSEQCYLRGSKRHCFRTSEAKRSWLVAQNFCKQDGYRLVIIDNDEVQETLESFLYESGHVAGDVWTGGQLVLDNRWSWVDGTPYSGENLTTEDDHTFQSAYVIVGKDGNWTPAARASFQRESFICRLNCSGAGCQHFITDDGSSDEEDDSVESTDGRFVVSSRDVRVTWFVARNLCLKWNGDLAAADVFQQRWATWLPRGKYWIGLRRNEVVWVDNHGKQSDVKWTQYRGNAFATNSNGTCLAMNLNGQWQWISKSCKDLASVVCHKVETVSVPVPAAPSSSRVPSLSTQAELIAVIVGCSLFFLLSLVVAVTVTYILTRRRFRRSIEGYGSSGVDGPIYDDNRYGSDTARVKHGCGFCR